MNKNLIISETMYYHPLLIQERLPVMISFNEKNEVDTVKDEIDELKIVPSFTEVDLYKRWVIVSGAFEYNKKRDMIVLERLEENIGLDLLLFTMDLAERARKEGKSVASPYRLEDYMLEASGILTRRVNAFRKAGYFN